MKTKRTIKFWTDSEIKACKTCNEKFENTSEGARFLAPRIGRTIQAVYVQMNKMKKSNHTRKAKIINKGIELPDGYTLDLTNIKRAILNKSLKESSLTLYF